MATIQKRRAANGEARYRALVRLKGSPSRSRTFRRKTDARRWAQEVEADLRRGRGLLDYRAEKHTLADLLRIYRPVLEDRVVPKDRDKRLMHLAWWESRLGTTPLSQIGPTVLLEHREALRRRKRPGGGAIGPSTRNRFLASLSAALSHAVEIEWLESNPVRRVRREAESRGRLRFLSRGEQQRLLEACAGSSDGNLLLLVRLALHTGARQAELLELRWRDIDFERRMAIIENTKNGERRSLPLVGRALESLQERKRAHSGPESDLIIVGNRGGVSFNQRAWKEALAKAEIEDFRFHDLRHTAASYLAMSGRSLVEIAEFLGHKTLAMVKRYSHLTEGHKVKVAEDMAARFLS